MTPRDESGLTMINKLPHEGFDPCCKNSSNNFVELIRQRYRPKVSWAGCRVDLRNKSYEGVLSLL